MSVVQDSWRNILKINITKPKFGREQSHLLRRRDNKLELCMSNQKYICRNCEAKEKKARVKKRRQEGKGSQRTTTRGGNRREHTVAEGT